MFALDVARQKGKIRIVGRSNNVDRTYAQIAYLALSASSSPLPLLECQSEQTRIHSEFNDGTDGVGDKDSAAVETADAREGRRIIKILEAIGREPLMHKTRRKCIYISFSMRAHNPLIQSS